MEDIISYAKTVLFFLLFVNLLMQLIKGSSYERFISPICGMILVILLLQPIFGIFGDGGEEVLYAAEQKLSLFFARNEEELLTSDEAGYQFAILEAYESDLKVQLSELLEKEELTIISADFSISAEEKEFGRIRGLNLVAEKKKENEKNKIEIVPISFGNEKKQGTVSAEEIRIKDKLADFYNVDEGNIYVSIREEEDG